MRPSAFRSSAKLLRTWEASRRSLATSTPKRVPTIQITCHACNRSLSPLPRHLARQRRFQNTSSTTAQQRAADCSIKSNPIPQSHYDFFPKTLPDGPPPHGPFHIDTRELRREFLQLQAVAHPDRHPASLKTRADATSARINEAYKALQNPLLRAQYLLSLRGIDVAEDESAKVEDTELLMEVLEAREEIESAEEEEELREIRVINEKRIRTSEEILDGCFNGDDLEGAKVEAVRLRYWVNIKESLDGWEKGKPVVLVH